MEDSLKYFTPEISDIHIGYECEWVDSRGDWMPLRVLNTQDIIDAFNDKLRTPYLTKEQIEKEGWEVHDKTQYSVENRIGFKKDNYFLVLDTTKEIPKVSIMVSDPAALWKELDYKPGVVIPEYFAFTAEIKSINEFRTQMKFLKL